MTTLNSIPLDQLVNVTGGQAGNTGITGGIPNINNKVPTECPSRRRRGQTPGNQNTGITGGIPGINNKVPPPPALFE